MVRATGLDVDNHRHARLPSCVTPVNTLTYYQIRPHAATRPTHKVRKPGIGMVSIKEFSSDGPSPVGEYQLLVHRLRLSASP